ncbi:MAG: hypothetical protein MRJ96_08950 [Nitrospirales bacterium]|nr:hypothetical protein [Nitrospira sp.]MDR4501560.1 hypothetical protein [Nitrospirales bacterium]
MDWWNAKPEYLLQQRCLCVESFTAFRRLLVCVSIVCPLLLIPHDVFGMSLERERVEDMPMKVISHAHRLVKAGYRNNVQSGYHHALLDVYLDKDRPFVREEIGKAFEESARLMRRIDPTGSLYIEIYCDQRGAGAYSLALGHRRSLQLQAYAHDLGMPRSQIRVVNFGNENPRCRDASTSCWEENIRIQSTFRYLAIVEPKFGCIGRLRIRTNDSQLRDRPAGPFLQRLRLAPVASKRSSVVPPSSLRQ